MKPVIKKSLTTRSKAIWVVLAKRGHGLTPAGGLQQIKLRKPMRRITKSLAAERRIYNKRRKLFLQTYPWCEVFPELRATEVHHRRRRGKNLLDESTWMSVSRAAHLKIHREIAWAYKMGYLERIK